jgi:hypothetical protein
MKYSALIILVLLLAAPLAAEELSFDNLRQTRGMDRPLFTTEHDGYTPPFRPHNVSVAFWAHPNFGRFAMEPAALLFGLGLEAAYLFNPAVGLRFTVAGLGGTYWYEPEEDEEDDIVRAAVGGMTATMAFRWRFWRWKDGASYLDAGLNYGLFNGDSASRTTSSLGVELIFGAEFGDRRFRGFFETGFSTLRSLHNRDGSWLRTPESTRDGGFHLILIRGGLRIYL